RLGIESLELTRPAPHPEENDRRGWGSRAATCLENLRQAKPPEGERAGTQESSAGNGATAAGFAHHDPLRKLRYCPNIALKNEEPANLLALLHIGHSRRLAGHVPAIPPSSTDDPPSRISSRAS